MYMYMYQVSSESFRCYVGKRVCAFVCWHDRARCRDAYTLLQYNAIINKILYK